MKHSLEKFVNNNEMEMEVFQVDAFPVKEAYSQLANYLIVEDDPKETNRKICAIYFSGHSIYFPNNEETFEKIIVKKNRFEWYGQRVKEATKHIFVRDIHKQWYLTGINAKLSSTEKLFDFLKDEARGYKVVCVGSSAGGYAALLFGSLLKADKIFAFSPRIEMHSLDWRSNPQKDPLYFRLKNTDREKYMDIASVIRESKSEMYVFYPIKSQLDIIQLKHIRENDLNENPHFHMLLFSTSKHGVPFPKIALNNILTIDYIYPKKKNINPVLFSIQTVGLVATIKGIFFQLKKRYIKK